MTFNQWFLSLEEGRQAVLRDDKWMLAGAAWDAGLTAGRDAIKKTLQSGGIAVTKDMIAAAQGSYQSNPDYGLSDADMANAIAAALRAMK